MDAWAIELLSSNTNLILSLCAVFVVLLFCIEFKSANKISKTNANEEKERQSIGGLRRPPGPKPYPIIGNMACFHGYEVPYQAFDDMSKKYGPIISLRLGSTSAVVVNGIDNIKEVLITKSSDFCDRPNFLRLKNIFRGNKETTLFFCNWSDLYKMRRKLFYHYSIPQNFSTRFQNLNEIIKNQMQTMIDDIKAKRSISSTSLLGETAIEIKPVIMHACANIFTQYFCSRSFSSNNTKLQQMDRNFDLLFWEFSQFHAADFLPFLLPLHSKQLKRIIKCTHEISEFILENIIQDRRDKWSECNDGQLDLVELFIDYVQRDAEPKMDWDTALYTIEEILAGYWIIANFLVKTFLFIGALPEVQQKIQTEIDTVTWAKKRTAQCDSIDLSDFGKMPYTEAVIMESLRLSASPFVPHLAKRNSSIGGYLIEKDTFVFLNNYNLNMSPELWHEPTAFKPERFIENGCIVKPDHFLPFSVGRRSCIGVKMVQSISFSILVSCMQHFSIRPPSNVTHKVTTGTLALPNKSYEMIFTERVLDID